MLRSVTSLVTLLLTLVAACGGSDAPADDAAVDAAVDAAIDAAPIEGLRFRVMTANIGTTPGIIRGEGEGGYTPEMAEWADEHYGNGLSWHVAEETLTDFLARSAVDIVVFQEGFLDDECVDVPPRPELDMICNGWTAERPLQVERLLGDDFQVACAEGQKSDNCMGVRRSLGRLRGCPEEGPCRGGLEGMGPPDGCSRGARISRVVIDLAEGGALTVVNVHGTSGFTEDDTSCRVSQFRQIFEDRGDGEPAASGEHNLVMGDFNTDPFRLDRSDPSAGHLAAAVDGERWHWLSPTSRTERPTYLAFSIDLMFADTLVAEGCFVPGVTADVPPVLDVPYWDHRPLVCDVVLPRVP